MERLKKEQEKQKLYQPKMRFRARTDLERIFDVLNSNAFGKLNKNVLNQNLHALDPDIQRKIEQSLERHKGVVDAENNIYGIKLDNRSKNLLKEAKALLIKTKKKKVKADNTGAMKLRKELYEKTHFKAATSFSIFNPNDKDHNHNHSNSRNIPKNYRGGSIGGVGDLRTIDAFPNIIEDSYEYENESEIQNINVKYIQFHINIT